MSEEKKAFGCGSKTNSNNNKVEETNKNIEESIIKEETQNMLKIGKPAPDFEVPVYHNGEFTSVKLSDYKGKWVLLCFYPGDFTFVWATEVSAVADRYKEFQDIDVEVISMSVDSVFVHKVWNDTELSKMVEGGVPYKMGSDAGGEVGKMYGIYDDEGKVDTRGRFIIDPDGIVQAFEVLTPPVGRNVSEALRQIQAYQHVRKHKGAEVTPSGWQPGKKTLKPSPDLVSNVWKHWTVDDAK